MHRLKGPPCTEFSAAIRENLYVDTPGYAGTIFFRERDLDAARPSITGTV